jgi:hypothetical protein
MPQQTREGPPPRAKGGLRCEVVRAQSWRNGGRGKLDTNWQPVGHPAVRAAAVEAPTGCGCTSKAAAIGAELDGALGGEVRFG